MLIVRFPNGQEVRYNDATFLYREANTWQLYTKNGGRWVASIQVSAGVTVEAVAPCAVKNPLLERKEVDEKIAKELRGFRATIRKLERTIRGKENERAS